MTILYNSITEFNYKCAFFTKTRTFLINIRQIICRFQNHPALFSLMIIPKKAYTVLMYSICILVYHRTFQNEPPFYRTPCVNAGQS